MASRDTLDNRIDAWKDQLKDQQEAGRAARLWGPGYGQVLRDNGHPSDQVNDGVLLPTNLKADGWVDVYESPAGFGWIAWFEAVEGDVTFHRLLECHEGGDVLERPWVVYDPNSWGVAT